MRTRLGSRITRNNCTQKKKNFINWFEKITMKIHFMQTGSSLMIALFHTHVFEPTTTTYKPLALLISNDTSSVSSSYGEHTTENLKI